MANKANRSNKKRTRSERVIVVLRHRIRQLEHNLDEEKKKRILAERRLKLIALWVFKAYVVSKKYWPLRVNKILDIFDRCLKYLHFTKKQSREIKELTVESELREKEIEENVKALKGPGQENEIRL